MADATLATAVLVTFHRFQRGSKSLRAAFSPSSSIESTSRVCILLFIGMLIMTVGN